jgi:hypothetical protein
MYGFLTSVSKTRHFLANSTLLILKGSFRKQAATKAQTIEERKKF